MNQAFAREVQCRSVLNRSGIPGVAYCLNPYGGCPHGCVYCYARFMARYRKPPAPWGSYLDVKINTAAVLEKQLAKARPGTVLLSSVSDPYPAAEARYGLTRAALELLAAHRFPVSVLTKSDGVLRDIDVLGRFPREECEVGFTIASLDERVCRIFEPGAPSPLRRLQALRAVRRAGVRTWVFIAPLLPGLSERTLPALLAAAAESADHVLLDGFHLRAGNWPGSAAALQRCDPALLPLWRRLCFTPGAAAEYERSIVAMMRGFPRPWRLCGAAETVPSP